jgi:hypothetical protein
LIRAIGDLTNSSKGAKPAKRTETELPMQSARRSGQLRNSQTRKSPKVNEKLANQEEEDPYDYDNIKLQSENNSEEEDRFPSQQSQNAYDFLKFTGILIYQGSFCCVLGQIKSANFASKYLLDMFKAFLVLRPVAIVCFTTYTTVLSWHRAKLTMEKLMALKQLEIAKDEQEAKLESTPKTPGLDKSNQDFVNALYYDDVAEEEK